MKKTISLGSRKVGALLLVLALGLTAEVANAATAKQAPIADAGSSRYAATDPVKLDGTGSYDPDNTGPLTYEWQQIAGPPLLINDANTATPTISGFTQPSDIQECEFELVVSDDELASLPDTVKVIIVPTFGASTFQQENPPFDPNKATVIHFGGGDCVTGWGDWGSTAWAEKANIISFPHYEPDSYGGSRTYYWCGDKIIVYLSSVAPDYKQPIQTIGFSTGGMPAIDVAIHLNLTYADRRYAVNQVTLLDAIQYCRDYSESISSFLDSSVNGEKCWIDVVLVPPRGRWYSYNCLVVLCPSMSHSGPLDWYRASLTHTDMNKFNNGIVAGAYWSVIGPGKNLQLATQTEAYYFRWDGDEQSGKMSFYDEELHPGGRLPEPVTLFVWRIPGFADDDPNGIVLSCLDSQNAVGYQLLSGSDPYDVADYNIVADSNSRAAATAAMLPSSDTWWTVKVRDAHGSTIYADPIRVDSQAGADTGLITLVDLNGDFKVDIKDFAELAQYWHRHEPSVDIVPTHNGDRIVDVKELAVLAQCWLKEGEDPTLVAHWKLDETEGTIAYDSAGSNDGTLDGDPNWQPTGGKMHGALQLDGINDYVSTPFVLNPPEGKFSVFAWIKGGTPGQVVLSQIGGADWLCADPSEGTLMTGLTTPRLGRSLISQAVITDGAWHLIGFVWDESYRYLYVDGAEVGKDTRSLAALRSADGGLYIGSGKNLEPGSFFTGLIDDVRIYNRAITP